MLMKEYQVRIADWMQACFVGDHRPLISRIKERCYRFIEEALELVQSLGCTKEDVLKWVDYVYGREKGEPPQEVGGVMVTLTALCSAASIDLQLAATAEYWRITKPEVMQKIREKQITKQVICDSKENPA